MRSHNQSTQGRRRRWSPLLLGAGVALAAGLIAGTAFAYLTTTGSGTGSGAVGAPAAVTVEAASGTVSSRLIPGGSGDLLVELANPNSGPVTIVGISQSGSVSASGASGVCTTTGVTVPTNNALSITVANGSNVVVTVPGGAQMGTNASSGCQGASFDIPVALTVRQ